MHLIDCSLLIRFSKHVPFLYRQGRIIGVDPALQQARLGLITAIALVLRQGLGILGISAPEKM